MPSARPATSAARRARTERSPRQKPAPRARPRRVPLTGPISRVRWDRLGRTVLLAVFLLVAVVGVEGVMTYARTRGEAQQQLAIVQSLARQNKSLMAQEQSLSNPATIVRDARVLGMVRQGERAYVVTGLPSH
jgi:cell division protein FtsB